jgi:ABC-type nitrate/sulfonate/bicarbonate transport system substrate-binding protein
MAFTSLSGSMSPPWYAQMGGIFEKNGLEVEVIAMPSGVEGMNALIAGEVQFLQIPGGTTVSGALGGALKAVLEELADRNPKAKEADPKKFFDDSFVRQMQASGFIDSLYR